jgi:diguanylate cyclase (GGDEF)-like protein
VSASLVDDEKHLYSVVFTDITKEENYKFELENLSIRDPLTNIGNRRYFTTQLQEYVTNSKRYPMCISLIMFDIDFFKKINDTYGHDVGDDVLVFYTKLIQEHLRENDIFCRIGGEEFMIILPYITKEQAEVVAEKLRALVEASREIVPLSMSFGVSEYKEGEEIKTFLKRVDDAVYDAKENGRNRVCVH